MQNSLPKLTFWLLFSALLMSMSSCNNRSIMFRAKRNYPYDDFSKALTSREYRIGLNDELVIKITSNKGSAIIDQEAGGEGSGLTGVVEYDGTIKMPLLGRVQVKDLTMRECELLFEERYKLYFVEPYVNIDVVNKRVVLFPGVGGSARVVTLRNQNTNLLEVLASSGGISQNAKAHRIKLIRGDLKNPQVFLIDLSTIDGMKKADLILQGNDIIYVEPRNDLVLNLVQRVTPYLAVLNLGLFIYAFIPGK